MQEIETPLGIVQIAVITNGDASIEVGVMPTKISNGMVIDHSVAALITLKPSDNLLDIKMSGILLSSRYIGTKGNGTKPVNELMVNCSAIQKKKMKLGVIGRVAGIWKHNQTQQRTILIARPNPPSPEPTTLSNCNRAKV